MNEELLNNLIIIDGDVSSFFEIGSWYTHLDKKDITYIKDKNQNIPYASDLKLILFNDNLVGYSYGISYYKFISDDLFNKYDKVYELLDFSIDSDSYNKEICICILDYLLSLVSNKGCNKLIIKKTYEEFNTFYEICKSTLKLKENKSYLYKDLKIILSEQDKLLIPSNNHILDLLHITYLKELGLDLYKDECLLSLNEITVKVKRTNGEISFLGCHFKYEKNKFYNFLYFIVESITNKSIKSVAFLKGYAYIDDTAILFDKSFDELLKEKNELVYVLKENGIKKIKCYNVTFNEYLMLSTANSFMDIDTIIKIYKKKVL